MQEKIFACKMFLITQRDHWVLFAIAMVAMNADGMLWPNFILWGVLSLVPFIFFLIRRYFNNFLVFLVCHIGLMAAMFLMPSDSIVEKVLICIITILYFSQSIYLKFRKSGIESNGITPVVSVGMIATSLFLQHFLKNYDFDNCYIVIFFAFFCIFAMQYYLENFLKFMSVNKSSAGHIPEKEILFTGISMSALYTAGGVIILLFATNIKWLEQIFKLIKSGLISILRFLLSFSKPQEQIFELEEEIVEDISDIILSSEEETSFWLWEVIENILFWAIIIGIAVVLIISIKKLIIYLIKRFGEKGNIKENNNQAVNDVRQKCEIEKRNKKLMSFKILFSPKEKIRRIYKKSILKEKEKIIGDLDVEILNCYTPMECGIHIENIEMVHLYEKARYSNEDCSRDDIRNMKKSSTDIRKSFSSYNE